MGTLDTSLIVPSRRASAPYAALISLLLLCAASHAAELVKPFDGKPTQWHDGFARYDFVMDEQTLTITPFMPPASERFAIGAPEKGKRRCVVIAPKTPAAGNPWSWRGCYWDHQPQTEVELLRRGFHIAYISADANLRPDKTWEAWYAYLTEEHGLSRRPSFIGMSRGGEYEYTWATEHPDQVACIYADNPGTNKGVISKLGLLADRDVPLLHVCGSVDPLLGRVSNVIESAYQQFGGRITVLIKDGDGHHPHSLRDPKPIADWIEANWKPREVATPAFVGEKMTRTSYYSNASVYRESKEEGKWITCRGAGFLPVYDRYSFELPGVEGAVIVTIPATPAAGTPWVFRCGYADRDAVVDLALLARGFHIVNAPMAYNADGPKRDQWTKAYDHLVAHGFSKRPAIEGASRAAGEMYAWAVENPQRVSCVYGENPVLRAAGMKGSLAGSLNSLAKAQVPILHVCGSLDPAYSDNSKAVAASYEALGGKMRVIVKEGQGHQLNASDDPTPAVEFVLAAQK
jgi:pimeloyl-ACP methyl ester carboxylesterase